LLRLIQSQSISLILLTHATVGHLAAFAHCCKNFPRFTHIPVYATRPVADLGRALIQDLYDSAPRAATIIPQESLTEATLAYQEKVIAAQNLLLQTPTVDELAKYFNLIQRLKYSQPHQPLPTPGTPPLNGLTITAYNSGRTLGGTIWHIQHGLESIVHAVDWNQARENVFAGAAWLGGVGGGGGEVIEQLRKPTALICSSRGAEKPAPVGGKAKRDEQLLDMLKVCVGRGGTALIPVDSSARVLELAYLLEHAWRDSNRSGGSLASAKIYLAGKNMSSTIRYARTMIEWMDDNINREFEVAQESNRKPNGDDRQAKDGGPFDFKYVKILERKAQVQKLLARGTDNVQTAGRVILASDTSLEWGFSRDLFMGLAKDSRNVLLLTEKPVSTAGKPVLAETVWNWWQERRDGVSSEQGDSGNDVEFIYAAGRELEVEEASRLALQGDELKLYQQWLAQRQLQEDVQSGGAAMGASANAVDDASSESSESEDSGSEQQGKALNFSSTMGARKAAISDEDLGVNILLKKKGVYDYDVRGKKGRDRMFPLRVHRKKFDEYGEVIRPEAFLRAEEKGHAAEQDGQMAEEGSKLGKKRKWGEKAKAADSKRPGLNRAVSDDGVSDGEADEMDAVEDTEPEVVGPARLVTKTARVTVNLRIAFVDFSGMHDKRSLNMLIPLIQPRKLILVGGSEIETRALAADCRKFLAAYQKEGEDFVFTPSVGETVNASVDTNAWTVRLAPSLYKTLNWQDVGDGMRIATVMGQLVRRKKDNTTDSNDEGPNKRQKTDGNGEDTTAEDTEVTLALPTSSLPAAMQQRKPIFVGDVRLADLRKSLQSAGYAVDFRGEGTLVVENCVMVRKADSGKIEVTANVRGALPRGDMREAGVPHRKSIFHDVRSAIYKSLAVVGG